MKFNLIYVKAFQSNGLTWIFRRMEEIIKQFISIITYQFIKSIQIKQQNFSLPFKHKFFYFFPIFFNTKCNSTYIIIVSRINPITNNKTPNYLRQIIFEIVLQSTQLFSKWKLSLLSRILEFLLTDHTSNLQYTLTTLFLGLVLNDEGRNGRDHLIIRLGCVLLLFLLAGGE